MSLNPYSWINDSAKVPVLVVLILSTIILSIALSSIGHTLKNEIAPQGIISFELAGSASRANQIVNSWSDAVRHDAFLSLGLDYLFLCIYPFAISLACHLAANKDKESGLMRGRLGAALSWIVIAAMPLDGIENYSLIRILNSSANELWPEVSRWCAIAKFGLVIIGSGYITIWLVLQLAGRMLRKVTPKAV
jgi:hypothetical protein